MSFFKKFFGNETTETTAEVENNRYAPKEPKAPIDEVFVKNFCGNGGKFIYCENLNEVHDNFLNILEENDWFETTAICFNEKLHVFLTNNNIKFQNPINPTFYFSSCEGLIADEGSIMLSSTQLKHYKPSDLPKKMVIFATTAQICGNKSECMQSIKKRYNTQFPSNITTISYFMPKKDDSLMTFGSSVDHLYLLLLED